MKIRFIKPDPRAGTVVQMDSSRGQHFVDTGAAEKVEEARTVAPMAPFRIAAPAPAPLTSAAKAAAPAPAMSKPAAAAPKPAAAK